MTATRPIPPTSAFTEPHWQAAREGHLDIQHCLDCETPRHPPRPICPECRSNRHEWRTVTGRGTVYTFTVSHRAPHPSFADQLPLVVAVVELEEGTRMTSNVVGCDPDDVRVGIAVEVDFLPLADSDIQLPVFRPART